MDDCERCGVEATMLIGVWVPGEGTKFLCSWCTLRGIAAEGSGQLRAKFPRRRFPTMQDGIDSAHVRADHGE